jgi:hypothetical protein
MHFDCRHKSLSHLNEELELCSRCCENGIHGVSGRMGEMVAAIGP